MGTSQLDELGIGRSLDTYVLDHPEVCMCITVWSYLGLSVTTGKSGLHEIKKNLFYPFYYISNKSVF